MAYGIATAEQPPTPAPNTLDTILSGDAGTGTEEQPPTPAPTTLGTILSGDAGTGAAEHPPPAPITLGTILSGDAGTLVIDQLDCIEDIAALRLCLAPVRPKELENAIMQRAGHLVSAAPLWSAVSNFIEDFCWSNTVAAADWRVQPFFAAMRAPAVCRVTGSGRCLHGLCQKQETPKEGVLELLASLHVRGPASSPTDASARDPSQSTVHLAALECSARLNGALGRNEMALRIWSQAADAGSARAQLDIGVRLYNSGTASTVYYRGGYNREAGPEAEVALAAGAEAMLRLAASNPSLLSLGLEGCVIKARAYMLLGMMALDGDGSTQDDQSALSWLDQAQRTAKLAIAKDTVTHEDEAEGPEDEEPMQFWGAHTCGSRAVAYGKTEYGRRMLQRLGDLEADARETMESMEGYMFFRNGRP